MSRLAIRYPNVAVSAGGPDLTVLFGGFRTNAPSKSHEERDYSTSLNRGNIPELAEVMGKMKRTDDLESWSAAA